MATLPALLLVVCGGGLGAGLRFLTGVVLSASIGSPWSTMLVNLAGSFLIGLLAGTQVGSEWYESFGKHFLVTGVLGGFTTYSAFALDSVQLLAEGRLFLGLVYAVGTAVGCIVAAWLGLRLGS